MVPNPLALAGVPLAQPLNPAPTVPASVESTEIAQLRAQMSAMQKKLKKKSKKHDSESDSDDDMPSLSVDGDGAMADRMKSFPNCPVPIFKRAPDANISSWIFQMEAYFLSCGIPERFRVMTMVCRIHSSHFEEIAPYTDKAYEYFKREL